MSRNGQQPRGGPMILALKRAVAVLLLGLGWMPGTAMAQEAAEAHAHPASRLSGRPHVSVASEAFDAAYYHLTLDVRFDPNYLYGRTRIEGRTVGAPMDVLVLDFSSTMQVRSVEAPDGTPLSFSHANDALHIDLPGTVAPGAPVAVDVVYEGLPQDQQQSFVLGRLPDGSPYAWTLSEPYGARAWWPSKDHPSDKADSVRVTVTVPEGLLVGSNGLLVQEAVENGRAIYDWFSRYPISTYLVSFAAGPYEVHVQTYERPDTLSSDLGGGQFPILHYEYADAVSFYEGNHPGNGWKRTVDVMPVLEYWFGSYPFAAEKYGHAQMTRGGGMEHQTMSSMGGWDVSLISHELTHQWFGDLITLEFWPHLWLNEGFATYGELLYWQARPEAYPGEYGRQFRKYYDRAKNAQGTLVVQDTTSVSSLFNSSRVYAKGGIVLHMLRGVVGDEDFRQILRAYTSDPTVRYGTATTADFHRIAEEVSGQDLDAFFRQWVTEGTGYPTYTVTWGYAPAETGYRVHAVLEQAQGPPQSNVEVFAMPVTFAVHTEEGEARFMVQNDQHQQSYTFSVNAKPTGLALDPDSLILRGETITRISTDPLPGEAAQPRIAELYPNPTSGALHVHLSLPEPGRVRLALYDVLGREVRVLMDGTLSADEQDRMFSIAGLAPGLYLLRLDGPGGSVSRPVVVQ